MATKTTARTASQAVVWLLDDRSSLTAQCESLDCAGWAHRLTDARRAELAALLCNPDCPPEVAADWLEEQGGRRGWLRYFRARRLPPAESEGPDAPPAGDPGAVE